MCYSSTGISKPKSIKNYSFYIIAILALNFSCEQRSVKLEEANTPTSIVKNLSRFLIYYKKNINLSDDFTGLDTDSSKMDKANFLIHLQSGKFIPIAIASRVKTYKLERIDVIKYPDVSFAIRNFGATAYKYYNMEGKKNSEI